MTLERSSVEHEYGVISTDTKKIKALFTETSDESKPPGITIVHGVGSTYAFFVFIPVEVYEALVLVHSDETFAESLIALSVRLLDGLPD